MLPGSRPLKILVVALAVVLLAGIAFVVIYPRVGEWYVRTRVLPRAAARLGRDITIEKVKVRRGRVELGGVAVGGLGTVDTIGVEFDFWPALFGDLRLGSAVADGLSLKLTRDAEGKDNWSDVLDKLRSGDGGGGGGGGGSRRLPRQVEVRHGSLNFVDEMRGVSLSIDSIEMTAQPHGHARATLEGVVAAHRLGPRAAATAIVVDAEVDDPKGTLAVQVKDGSAMLWPKLSLTGIEGMVRASLTEPGRARIDLAGSYGGSDQKLWTAEGSLDPAKQEGELHLRASRFTLDKIEKVLVDTPIQSPEKTSIDGSLDLELKDGVLSFAGALDVAGLTLFHAWMADDPVADLGFRAQIAGRYLARARILELGDLTVDFRGVQAKLDGAVALPGGEDEGGVAREKRRLRAHLQVPPVPCQTALDALPPQITPRLQGFKLDGKFDADVQINIDWANLDALELGGSVGLGRCKVKAVPDDLRVERLLGEFDHTVEIEENQFVTFTVGPTNPDFVPLAEVSPYLTNSLISTEDFGFMKHHGFIVREFRTALISDLKEGYFKYGASSITMQLVKNVFLYKQKTLARKLQELFLTWYVETVLTKERLLEIYVNVIEFGPGIFGIGPAARHYFGKSAKEISPVEAAFFSSILPNPKQRYLQYCEGELNRWGDAKVQRILKLEHDRGLLTDEDYTQAVAAPLLFDRTEALPPDECKEMVRRMIHNTRPTAPGRKTAR